MEVDIVCRMEVEMTTAPHRSEYKGRMFYFCCPKCKEIFDKNPEIFIHGFHYELNYSETKPDKCECEKVSIIQVTHLGMMGK